MNTEKTLPPVRSHGLLEGRITPARGRRWQGEKWTSREVRILKECAETMTSAEIGMLLKRSTGSITNAAQKRGIALMKHGQSHHLARHSDQKAEAARCLYDAGWKLSEIAKHVGANFYTCRGWIYFQTRKNDPVTLS